MWIKKIEIIIIFIIIIQKLNIMFRMFEFCPRNRDSDSDSEYDIESDSESDSESNDSVGIQIYSEIEETLPKIIRQLDFQNTMIFTLYQIWILIQMINIHYGGLQMN